MRSSRRAAGILVVSVAFIVAACGGAVPGGSSTSGRPATSPPASETAAAAPSPLTGKVVEISAQSHAFDQASVSAPADEPFHIVFANNELLTPHNVEIKDAAGAKMFMGKVFDGEKTMTYDVPALPAGTYLFRCTVHPEMQGELVAA